jgi:hypothetical protein
MAKYKPGCLGGLETADRFQKEKEIIGHTNNAAGVIPRRIFAF